MKAVCYLETPVGKLGVAQEGAGITDVFFTQDAPPLGAKQGGTPLLDRAVQELREYFAGVRREFDLPLAPQGTAFQRAVWEALRAIPYGQTRSYAQIAAQIGRPTACRAVGGANHCNPIAIIIPCHRVVGASGALTGYAGGLDIKEYLLRLEGAL